MSSDRAKGFERTYSIHFRDIASYVVRRVPRDEVEVVVVNVFVVAWRRFERVPAPPDDRLWLFGLARRCVAEHTRSRARQGRLRAKLADEEFSVEATSSSAPDPRHDLVLTAMAKLKTLDRECLQLVLWDELSHADAAAVLGCSVNAFELRYQRARNRVRDDIDVSVDASTRPTPSALTDVPLTPKEATA